MKTSNIQPPTRSTNLTTRDIEKMVLGKNSESPNAELPRAQTGLEVHIPASLGPWPCLGILSNSCESKFIFTAT